MNVIVTNAPLQRLIGMSKSDIEGASFFELADKQWDQPDLHTLFKETLTKNSFFKNHTVLHFIPKNGKQILSFNARRIHKPGGLSTLSHPN
ncbi:MAG: hypothetical protein M3Q80_01980, partial [bacterium]|nr:hypothetical protein [bacterium]